MMAETCHPSGVYMDLAHKLFSAWQVKMIIAVFVLTSLTELVKNT
jgi:hypothetical protein